MNILLLVFLAGVICGAFLLWHWRNTDHAPDAWEPPLTAKRPTGSALASNSVLSLHPRVVFSSLLFPITREDKRQGSGAR